MIRVRRPGRRAAAIALLIAGVVSVAGCAAQSTQVPSDVNRPDEFLFQRGTEALERSRWQDARDYFGQILDNYPQSPYRPEAKLGMGDAYMGEGGTEALLRAATEFREFLTLHPTNARADYAQFRLAMSYHRQMRAPGRDQTDTQTALTEFDTFVQRYPASPLMPEVRERQREARNRLSQHIYGVGLFYYRSRNYIGAMSRFREVLADDPEFTGRDGVYFHLAESLARVGRTAEAAPYYQRLVDEFDQSEHLADARRRLSELPQP